jgi:hypothetical protein
MRRFTAVWVAAALTGSLAASAEAQSASYLGVVAGVNFATLHTDGDAGVKTRTGFVGGIYNRSQFTKEIGLETQILYSEQGAKGFVEDADATGTLKLSYIKVPVLLAATIPTSGMVHPRLFVGPAFGFKVGCTLTGTVAGFSASVSCEDAGIKVKTFEAGAAFGGGIDIGYFTIAARYDLGLTTINGTTDLFDVKNRVLSLTAGYGIRLN